MHNPSQQPGVDRGIQTQLLAEEFATCYNVHTCFTTHLPKAQIITASTADCLTQAQAGILRQNSTCKQPQPEVQKPGQNGTFLAKLYKTQQRIATQSGKRCHTRCHAPICRQINIFLPVACMNHSKLIMLYN